MYCDVEAEPGAKSFHWRLNNDTLTNFTWNAHSSVITLVPRVPSDLGRLHCWASNQAGVQRKPCVFTLVPARDPESPRNCTLHNRTVTAFVVECEPGDDGGMPAVYVLQVLDEFNRTVLHVNATDRPVWYVSGLSGGARLSLLLYALTAKGRSAVGLLRARTLAGSQSLTEPLWPGSLSPLLVVLIACAVGLVSVAFLVMLLLRFKANKERHKRTYLQHYIFVHTNFLY